MRMACCLAVAIWGILGPFPATAGDYATYERALRAQRVRNAQTYSPVYGYSTGQMGGGNFYGNGGPYMGRGHFLPGYGYGSIYGNSGHPGFGRYTGPAWNHPAAWGY